MKQSSAWAVVFLLLVGCTGAVPSRPKHDPDERWWWKGTGPPRGDVEWLSCERARERMATEGAVLVDLGAFESHGGPRPPCDAVGPQVGDTYFNHLVLHAIRKRVAREHPERVVERYFHAEFDEVRLGLRARGSHRYFAADRKAPHVIRLRSATYRFHTVPRRESGDGRLGPVDLA
ncbi:MAG: hypothetical protein ACLFU2_13575, partial [Opitutales bacterium]